MGKPNFWTSQEDLHLRQSNFTACSKYKVRKLGYEKKRVEQEKTNFMVKCSTQWAADWDPIDDPSHRLL